MKITYLGTTVLLFDDGDTQLLFDAYVSRQTPRHAIFGKIQSDESYVQHIVDCFQMDHLKGIFVSHSHFDHVLDVASFSRITHSDIYGSASTLNVARGGDVEEEKLHRFSLNQSIRIGKFCVTVLPSIHSKVHWYNNDLGKTIDEPISQPCRRSQMKEGGSYDFLIEHEGNTYLIRPSFNYLKGQLDSIHCNLAFLGVTGMARESKELQEQFFMETLEKVKPKIVIPLHWDNFFAPIEKGRDPSWFHQVEKTKESLELLNQYCLSHGIAYCKMMPLSSKEFFTH